MIRPPPRSTLFPSTTLFRSLLLLAAGRFIAPLLEGGAAQAPHAASALRLAAYTLATLVLFVTAFAFFGRPRGRAASVGVDRKSTRLNSSHLGISYAVFCLPK